MIVFDTETTGLPKSNSMPIDQQPKIIEFAAIKLDDDTLEEVDRIEFFCNPREKLTEFIIDFTGITDDMLKDEPVFQENYLRLCEFFLGEKEMVAHNCQFDRSLLTFELRRLNKVDRFPWPYIHTCTVEKSLPIKKHKMKLLQLYKHATGSDIEEAHRAMADVESLVACVKYLRKEGMM
jgi:DNA polymerase-3 subunit alpha (Gram-positive type)